jgi:hypothetical protein
MKTFSPEISLCLLILFLISQQLLFYFLFCYKILTKQVTAMKTKLILSFLFIILSITACNTTEPPPPPDGEKPTLELTLEDVSCTEAWIELTTTNLQLPTTITLKQIDPAGDTSLSNLKSQYSRLTALRRFPVTKPNIQISYNHTIIQPYKQ